MYRRISHIRGILWRLICIANGYRRSLDHQWEAEDKSKTVCQQFICNSSVVLKRVTLFLQEIPPGFWLSRKDSNLSLKEEAFPVSHEWLRASMNVSQSTCAGSMALWFLSSNCFALCAQRACQLPWARMLKKPKGKSWHITEQQ